MPYIINPQNNKGAWFDFPLYFGKLSRIGHSGSYDDSVEIISFEGDSALRPGFLSHLSFFDKCQ